MLIRRLRIVFLALVIALAGAQFFQPARTNPPSDSGSSLEAVARPPAEVTRLLNRACRDCHSNETVWPWYSKVAPVSWLVAQDVKEGRSRLNFSEWGRFGAEMARSRLHKVCEQAREGEMPLWYYVPLHPEAKLGNAEINSLCAQFPEGRTD